MARRGFAILFTLLGVAFFISIVGFGAAVSRCSAASRRCRRTATLVLRVGGDLAEVAPADVVGYLRGVTDADRRGRSSTTCARRRSIARVSAVLLKPTGFDVAVLGQGAGNPRRGARLQEVGQAGLRLSRIRRRPRVLPGQRRRQGLPDAVEPARSDRRRHLRAVPARHARQDRRRIRICTTSATTRPRSNTFTEKGYTAGAPGDGRVAQPRSVRSDRARHRRRPQEERGRRPHADRRGAVPAGGRAARRAGRRCRVRGSGRREAARRGEQRRAASTATTTRASAPRRSA